MVSLLSQRRAQSVVATICLRQSALGLTDAQVALAAGYRSERIYRLVKQGQAKLALDRIGALASVLDMPYDELLRIALSDYQPHLLAVFEQACEPASLSCAECQVIDSVRRAFAQAERVRVSVNGAELIIERQE